MRHRLTILVTGSALLLSCGAPEPEPDTVEQELRGDVLLASATTLDPRLSPCGGKLYSGLSSSYLEILRTAPVHIEAGEAVYAQSRISVTSNSNDNQMFVIRVRALNGAGKEVRSHERQYGGRNHIGKDSWADKAAFAAMLLKPEVTDDYRFILEARAGQTGCGAGPTDYCTPATSCGTESLNIVTAPGYTYVNVWSADPGAVEVERFGTWATGYANITTANSAFNVINGSRIRMPSGKTTLGVALFSGNTMNNALPSTQGNWRLRLVTGGVTTYFPSAAGITTTISAAEHHHQIVIEGSLSGLSAGQFVSAYYEVSTITPGAYLHVDTGAAGAASSQTALFMLPRP